mmetsp:Transcript_1439/g.1547  ORF Transcript_1439/g.1547 Transcript_1439/m.1547 type:complete len:137 (+) Transcript_1439:124-534(+)
MSHQAEIIPCASPSRILLNTRQQQRNRIDVGRSIYSRPLQNKVVSMPLSTSLHRGILSNAGHPQQVLSDSSEQWQKCLRDKAAAESILTDLVYPPSTHATHARYPQFHNGMPMSRHAYMIEQDHQHILLRNVFNND